MQGSPELLEVKMGTDGYSDGSDDNNRDIDNENSVEVSTQPLIAHHLGNNYPVVSTPPTIHSSVLCTNRAKYTHANAKNSFFDRLGTNGHQRIIEIRNRTASH